MNIIEKLLNYIKYNISKSILPFHKEKETIWLIGENLGNYASDNGYYFFEYMMSNHQEKVYFVYNNNNLELLNVFQNNIVKRNSIKHYILYAKSKYIVVSHGINDAIPAFIVSRRKNEIKPIIYLQHGIIKFKSIYYNCESYNKSILRFIVSSDKEKEIVTTKMQPKIVRHELMHNKWELGSHMCYEQKCKDKELYNYINKYNLKEQYKKKIDYLEQKIGIHESRTIITGLARHDGLIEASKKVDANNQILIFPTWRDDLYNISSNEFEESNFYKSYSNLLQDKKFNELLEQNSFKVKFILHSEMTKFKHSFDKLSSSKISIQKMPKDLRTTVLASKYLITDYSSISWEFNLLNKPVIFFHFDYEDYYCMRDSYIKNASEWFGQRTTSIEELTIKIKTIIEKDITYVNYDTQEIKYRDGGNCLRIYNEIRDIPSKVYFLAYNIFGIGGTVRTIINTANYLYSKGYDVEIISIKRTSAIPKLGLHPGIKIRTLYDVRNTKGNLLHSIKKSIIKILSLIPSFLINKDEDLYHMFSFFTDVQLMKILKSLNDCVLVTTTPSFNYLATEYCRDNVKKIGQEHKSYHIHSDNIKSMITKSYPKLDTLTVLTHDDYKTYQKTNLLKNNQLFIQPNGTYVEKLEDGLENRPKRIISLARLTKGKRLDILIKSFVIIHKKFPDWTLAIFGNGEEKDTLINLVKELNLASVVSIKPSTNDIKKELISSSIFALPSENEGFGMTIIEANSFGVPAVAFDIPNGPRQLIQNYQTGLFAQPFDIEDFAHKLSLLIEDSALRVKLGYNAYSFVKANYSVEKVGEEFERLLS